MFTRLGVNSGGYPFRIQGPNSYVCSSFHVSEYQYPQNKTIQNFQLPDLFFMGLSNFHVREVRSFIFTYFHIFLTNVEPCCGSDWPPSGLLCLFGTVGKKSCCKVIIVKCDFLKTSMFVKTVTQHPLTWVYGLDHFPQAIPRKPTSMFVKPVSGINFYVSFKESSR